MVMEEETKEAVCDVLSSMGQTVVVRGIIVVIVVVTIGST